MVSPDALAEPAANDDVPDFLGKAVERRVPPVSTVRPASRDVRRVAQDLFSPVFRGRMATLYRESKVTELLALHLNLMGQNEPGWAALSSREVLKVREAHDRLLADLRDPPDLSSLATSVGMTTKRLNEGFRALYGTTVFDYLLEVHMTAARDALAEGLDVPLKQLAWQLGYNQPSNFINAFRRRFGVAPGGFRRHRD